MAEVVVKEPSPPREELSAQSDENDSNKSQAMSDKLWSKPPPPEVDSEEHKRNLDEESLDEMTEQKKNTSIGAILSGLSTGSYGSKAKENVVKIEEVPRKRYRNDYWGANRNYGGDGDNGNGWGDHNWSGGGWEGGNNWNSWNEQQNYGYGDVDYGPAPMEEETNDDWIEEENKRLEEEFGPGVISILADEDGHVNYICDICQAQMNNRKSLDLHLNGVKHLKRKNLWDKKRKLEGIKENSEDKKDENDQKKPDSNQSKDVKNSNEGYNFNNRRQGGPPSAVMANPPQPVPFPPPVNIPQNQWNPAPVPPPQPVEKPKQNLTGGATGTLLQKLAACAVKNLKDSDLATNVIIALVKSMKAYNHTRGDTRSIEVLTEMDVKLRGLKVMLPSPETDKASSKTNTNKDPSDISNKENSSKSKVSQDNSKTSELLRYESKDSRDTVHLADGSGTWYSQGKGSSATQPYSMPPTDTKKALPSTLDYNQPPPKTGYMSDTNSKYPLYNMTQNPPPPPVKDASGYYSQPPYGQPPVMDFISAAPPPPPPVDNSGYGSYGTQYPGGYGGYYNTGAAPPPPPAGGYM